MAARQISGRRTVAGGVVAATGLVAGTVLLAPQSASVSLAGVALLYLVPVVGAAAVGGLWPGLAAAVGADLLVNFFFVPPLHTLAVQSSDHVIVLVVYLL